MLPFVCAQKSPLRVEGWVREACYLARRACGVVCSEVAASSRLGKDFGIDIVFMVRVGSDVLHWHVVMCV